MKQTLRFIGIALFSVGCMHTVPIQAVAGAGVSPQGTAFFVEVRDDGYSESLLLCREFPNGPPQCRRTPIEQPQRMRLR